MPIRLPIPPARRLFYTPISVWTNTGQTIDGRWIEGEPTEIIIAGSFQPPAPLRLDIGLGGDVGLGDRQLFTTWDLPFYDIDSPQQSWVFREKRWWRITDRHPWDSWVSRNLHVYSLERFHRTSNHPFLPPPDPSPEPDPDPEPPPEENP